VERGHVRGEWLLTDRIAEALAQHAGQFLFPFARFDAPRGRRPHEIGAASREGRGGVGRSADNRSFHPGTSRVAGFGRAIHQYGASAPLATSRQMQHRTRRPLLFGDLLLKKHEPLQYRFGPWRATGDVDVHGQNLVDSLHHAVNVVHAPAVGTGPHGDHPFGLRHLLVKAQDDRSDLFKHRSGDDQEIGLPG